MNILYVGQLWPGSTSAMRLDALRQLGHRVVALNSHFDPRQLAPAARTLYRVMWRLGWPSDPNRINALLIEQVRTFRPDVVWIDKGVVVTRSTLRELKAARRNAVIVHYNPDDPFGGFGYAGWRTFLDALPAYDMHFVPRKVNVPEYREQGAQRVVQALPAWGYAPDVHRPTTADADFRQRFASDVMFVGSFEDERAKTMCELGAAGVDVHIVGEWPDAYVRKGIRVTPAPLYGTNYARALCSAKIALGFLRKKNRDEHTSRSVEIPACGVFMLAERSGEHLDLFEEGVEAEFFGSSAELIDKTRFYLQNDAARERIALAGMQRCHRSGYDNAGCMSRMLESVTTASTLEQRSTL